jgi:hypothetical protein
MGWVLLAATLVMVSACVPENRIEKIADDEKEQIARDYIQRMTDGDFEALASELESSLRTPTAAESIEKLAGFLPKEPPSTVNLVGYQYFKQNDQPPRYNLTYQFGYGSKWVLANAAWFENPDGSRLITGLSAYQLQAPLQETYAFSFKNAGVLQYLFLFCSAIVPLFIVFSLVACIRTRMRKGKWIWILFILVGMVQFSINWTTGQVGVKLLHLQLLGAGVLRASIYSPWILMFSLPVGAAVFWFRRNMLEDWTIPTDAPPDVPAEISEPPRLS